MPLFDGHSPCYPYLAVLDIRGFNWIAPHFKQTGTAGEANERLSVMPMNEIPPHEWRRFFQEFSRRHRGWLVRIAERGADAGILDNTRDLPLMDVALHLDGPEQTVSITVQRDPYQLSIHCVASPMGVKLEETRQNQGARLHIASASDVTTVVAFRPASVKELAMVSDSKERRAG